MSALHLHIIRGDVVLSGYNFALIFQTILCVLRGSIPMKKLLSVMLLTVLTAALTGCSGGMGGRLFSGGGLFGGGCRRQQCNACYQQPTCCPAPVYSQSIPAYGGGCCGGQNFGSPYQDFGSPCQSCGDGGMAYQGMEMPGMMMPGPAMQGTIIQDGPIYGGDQIPVLPGPTPAPTTVPGPSTSPLNP